MLTASGLPSSFPGRLCAWTIFGFCTVTDQDAPFISGGGGSGPTSTSTPFYAHCCGEGSEIIQTIVRPLRIWHGLDRGTERKSANQDAADFKASDHVAAKQPSEAPLSFPVLILAKICAVIQFSRKRMLCHKASFREAVCARRSPIPSREITTHHAMAITSYLRGF
jgi:hypothetical protein